MWYELSFDAVKDDANKNVNVNATLNVINVSSEWEEVLALPNFCT